MQDKHPFQLMIKPVGPVCNLQCDYCYYLEKTQLYKDRKTTTSAFGMSPEVLENCVREYIGSQDYEHILFTWQGGEPTMLQVDFFRKVVALQKKYAGGKRISNSIQTNGTLITEEWADFLANNNFLVGLSIDGPADLHDHYRSLASGKGSFGRIMDSVRLFHKYSVEFNTITTVNNRNSRMPLRVYHFLKDIGSTYMQFIPVVEREAEDQGEPFKLVANDYKGKARVTPESVESPDWGKFLARIFDEWVRIDIGRHYVNYFDNTLACYAGEVPSMCTMQEVCGAAPVMEHNGDVYACDHYVYPQFLLGNMQGNNLGELAGSDFQLDFGREKRENLPRECRECEFLPMCGGDCPKHRFLENDEGELISYLHDGFLFYFRHVDKYMKIMAGELEQQRAPSNIMNTFPGQERKKLLRRKKIRYF